MFFPHDASFAIHSTDVIPFLIRVFGRRRTPGATQAENRSFTRLLIQVFTGMSFRPLVRALIR